MKWKTIVKTDTVNFPGVSITLEFCRENGSEEFRIILNSPPNELWKGESVEMALYHYKRFLDRIIRADVETLQNMN